MKTTKSHKNFLKLFHVRIWTKYHCKTNILLPKITFLRNDVMKLKKICRKSLTFEKHFILYWLITYHSDSDETSPLLLAKNMSN